MDTICWTGGAGLFGLFLVFIVHGYVIHQWFGRSVGRRGRRRLRTGKKRGADIRRKCVDLLRSIQIVNTGMRRRLVWRGARDEQLSLLLADCADHLGAGRLTEGVGRERLRVFYQEVLALDFG